jgi:hypothetical protein
MARSVAFSLALKDIFLFMTAVQFAEFLKNRRTIVLAGRQKMEAAISVHP